VAGVVAGAVVGVVAGVVVGFVVGVVVGRVVRVRKRGVTSRDPVRPLACAGPYAAALTGCCAA
jgi:tetrahydromethanopterin S-methyltransferase subunit C